MPLENFTTQSLAEIRKESNLRLFFVMCGQVSINTTFKQFRESIGTSLKFEFTYNKTETAFIINNIKIIPYEKPVVSPSC